MTHALTSILTPPCPFCGERVIIDVPHEQYESYLLGTPVQKAFPQLTPPQRERILSGLDQKCWDKIMSEFE